jgi:glycosyltransferase involved in cell wall biosynthesis
MSQVILSVIIPCFKHGAYLPEAIESIEEYTQHPIEIIIINDGSPDELTQNTIKSYQEKGYHIIDQTNQGLAKSRNNGILVSSGKYILPLDADNKIITENLGEAIQILENNPSIDIVYTDRILFGDQEGYDSVGSYNLQKLMLSNYIDACAIYRQSVWAECGGYDANMPAMGAEDWEMWINASFKGKSFYYLPKPIYAYRLLGESMARSITGPKYGKIKNYLQDKYPNKLGFTLIEDAIETRFKRKPFMFILKIILRAWFKGFYKKLQDQGKIQEN